MRTRKTWMNTVTMMMTLMKSSTVSCSVLTLMLGVDFLVKTMHHMRFAKWIFSISSTRKVSVSHCTMIS